MKRTDAHVYEVTGVEDWSLLDSPERVLAELAPTVRLLFSSRTWVRYEISSRAVDGVLSTEGFTVTNPKHAALAGVRPGDTIVRVNGRRADGLAGVYAISWYLRHNLPQAPVQVEIRRPEGMVTKTFVLQ